MPDNQYEVKYEDFLIIKYHMNIWFMNYDHGIHQYSSADCVFAGQCWTRLLKVTAFMLHSISDKFFNFKLINHVVLLLKQRRSFFSVFYHCIFHFKVRMGPLLINLRLNYLHKLT